MPIQPIPKRGARNPVTRTLERFNNWDLLSVFDPSRSRPYPRTVLINVDLPAHATTTTPAFPIPGLAKERDVEGPHGGAPVREKVARGFGTKNTPSEGWIFASNQVLTSKVGNRIICRGMYSES